MILVAVSLGAAGNMRVDADSDCFYTPFDSAQAGQYYPALIILSCTGATRTDLDSIIPMADSLGIIAATCHASRNHRDIGVNDRDILSTHEKLVLENTVDQ